MRLKINNSIKVDNKKLQAIIDEFVNYIQEDAIMRIDLNQKIVPEEKMERYNQLAIEFFDNYELLSELRWELATFLDNKGYRIFERYCKTTLSEREIVQEALKKFVWDTIKNHHQKLIKN